MSDTAQALNAARAVESLINAARDLLADAQRLAEDARLVMIAKWLGERVESLDDELLKEVRATVVAFEKRHAETVEPKS